MVFKGKFFIHNIDSGYYFEILLLSAAISILVVRFYLYNFNYPQIGGAFLRIGGGSIQFAHMIWGGFLMLAAIVLLLAFFGRAIKKSSAIIGGVGFGVFIDELGKFITRDNDYFFQPTVALIYVIFVVLFLVFRFIERRRRYSHREYLAFAFDLVRSAALDRIDVEAKERARDILEKCNQESSVVGNLKKILDEIDSKGSEKYSFSRKLSTSLRAFYKVLVAQPWFTTVVVVFFLLYAIFSLYRSYSTMLILLDGLPVSYMRLGELISSVAAAVVSVLGMVLVFRTRLSGYRFFRDSVLISIFLTQFFDFYINQFGALVGLAINLVAFLILEFMIYQEEHRGH